MTIRDWCSSTNNVFYGATFLTVYQTGKQPIRAVVGIIPAEIANCNVICIRVTKVNPYTLTFLEVEVMIHD